jgi:paired amphipathic helix protein Sin3a
MNNPPHGPSAFDRDREREYLEEQNRQRALHQQEELAQREREFNERQERDRQQREQHGPAPPHQSNTGSIPIHQPVASRITGAMHSPGGLLSTHGGAPPSGPLGAPSGPGNAFGGPLHSEANRGVQHQPQTAAAQLQQHQGFGPSILGHNAAPPNVPLGVPGGAAVSFGSALQQQQQQQEAASRLQQIPFAQPITQAHQMQGAPALGQGGQQPILNVSFIFST